MSNRLIRSDWPASSRPTAVVAEALSKCRTILVSAEPGPDRDRFAKECVAASVGKRILIFAPDEVAAEPIRSRLAKEIATRNACAEQDRIAVAKAAALRTLAEAERELSALRATATVKPGFFAKLFGKGGQTKLIAARISEWDAKRAAAEAEIRRLDGKNLNGIIDNGQPAPQESTRTDDSATHSLTDVSTTTPFPFASIIASPRFVFATIGR